MCTDFNHFSLLEQEIYDASKLDLDFHLTCIL